jgi:PIN domain nuclease of toxin-antitoxin system
VKPALLLDTHIALWWFAADTRLAAAECELIRSSRCHVSLASLWEIAIKHRLNKLPVSPQDFLGAIEGAAIRLLPINPPHILAIGELPLLHGDPFDRLLIAQSRTESLLLLTADARLAAYGGPIRII